MNNITNYFISLKFSLSFSFRYVPKETIIVFLLFILGGFIPYASAFLLGELVNRVIQIIDGSNDKILYVVILYALVNTLPLLLGNLQSYVNRIRMIKFQMETALELLKKRESIDIATYEDPKFQDLLQRSFRNGLSPIFQITNSQLDAIRSLTSLIFGTVLAIHFNLYIYMIVVLTAIPSFYTDIKYASKFWSIWAKDSPEQRKLNDLQQHLTSRTFLVETKLLQSGRKLMNIIKNIFLDFNNKQLGLEKNRVWQTSFADLVAFIGFSFGLILVVKSVTRGEYPVGTLVYMISTLSSIRKSVSDLLESVSGQYENSLIVKDMIEFFDTKSLIVESQNPVTLGLKSAPEIIFDDVSFKYYNSDKWSLRNVNLTFKAGDNIGLVGNNGAGKTTLVKLLCRIYDPTEGRILINGIDLKDVSTKEWWGYMAVMFQDYANYDFLVKDAIAISRPDKPVNLTKVIDAAKTSQSHDFIMEWKDKYDEQLGVEFKGKEPSKGQRQKLSIAKILYRDGFVLILDEPTASVDAEAEAKIFDSIENLPKDRTAILISHDFSTISQCDKIFVLDKNYLVEEGSHKELMSKGGLYSELYKLQAKRFKK